MSSEILVGKQGYIVSYRRGRHVIQPQFAILKFPDIKTRVEAAKLLGKIVGWETPTGKLIKGKISRIHGNNGAVAAHFVDGGLPGQAFGTFIKILK